MKKIHLHFGKLQQHYIEGVFINTEIRYSPQEKVLLARNSKDLKCCHLGKLTIKIWSNHVSVIDIG